MRILVEYFYIKLLKVLAAHFGFHKPDNKSVYGSIFRILIIYKRKIAITVKARAWLNKKNFLSV